MEVQQEMNQNYKEQPMTDYDKMWWDDMTALINKYEVLGLDGHILMNYYLSFMFSCIASQTNSEEEFHEALDSIVSTIKEVPIELIKETQE
jgi:hypothetical protein